MAASQPVISLEVPSFSLSFDNALGLHVEYDPSEAPPDTLVKFVDEDGQPVSPEPQLREEPSRSIRIRVVQDLVEENRTYRVRLQSGDLSSRSFGP